MSNEEQIQHFIAVTGVDEQRARFYLESAAWNLEMATASFFEEGEEMVELPEFTDRPQNDAVPSAEATSGTTDRESKGKKSQPASNSRFGTIAGFQQAEADSESNSDEEGQAYFAGGSEHSGQQIIGPPKKKDKNLVENLFKSAKDHGAEVVDKPESHRSTAPTFRGTGYKLGQTDDDSEAVHGGALRTGPRQVDMTLKLWKNGFSVDDGPLRDFKDPTNKGFLDSVSKGEVPRELVSMAKGGEVSLNMEDHRNEDFVKPKVNVKAFSGAGHTLGSPAPNVVSNPPSTSSGSAGVSTDTVMSVDESQPTTNLQIRLADGSRLVSKFNHTHTITDIRNYIVACRPQYAGANFILLTTFPNKELSDETQSLTDANLINAVIVQRLK